MNNCPHCGGKIEVEPVVKYNVEAYGTGAVGRATQ